MATYNLMKAKDRDRLRAERQAELHAIREGRWPRDTDDQMRWEPGTAEHAARMCQAEIAYLDDVERRIAAGAGSLAGWEA